LDLYDNPWASTFVSEAKRWVRGGLFWHDVVGYEYFLKLIEYLFVIAG